MKIKIISIRAWGYAHSCMKLSIDDNLFSIYISRDLYYCLRDKGVPIFQKLRFYGLT